jgi:hypothetical protein
MSENRTNMFVDQSEKWSDKGVKNESNGVQADTEFDYTLINKDVLIPWFDKAKEEQGQQRVMMAASVCAIIGTGHLPKSEDYYWSNGEHWDDAEKSYKKYKDRIEASGGIDHGWQRLVNDVNPAKPSDGEVPCIIRRHSNT